MTEVNKIKDASHRGGIEASGPRSFCWTCRQPRLACYCSRIRPMDVGIDFVVLIHPIEARRRIATGRMAHLVLKGSSLIEGEDFSNCPKVQRLMADGSRHCVILYPGKDASDLDLPEVRQSMRQMVLDSDKRLTIFVIDGTWATARKMMRLSTNLRKLPTMRFQPSQESRFQVRKQPEPHCLSTIEAIHETIERLSPHGNRKHDHLLELFLEMVERQKAFVPHFQNLVLR